MKKYIVLGTLSLVASAFLTACGSSSSSNSSDEYLDGYFIDAPVANCEYETSSGKKGRTDENGKFQYKSGESVKFSIGKLTLGECEPTSKGLVTPNSFQASQEATVTLLRVLQALDSDNDPSNGITIPNEVLQSLQELSTEVNISNLQDDSDILAIDDTFKQMLDENGDNTIDVNEENAKAHFEESVQKWNNEHAHDNQSAGEGDSNGNGNGSGNGNHGNNNGNSDDSNSTGNGSGHGDGDGFNIDDYPASTLNDAVIESLAYMGNEERLAYDVYNNLYNYHADRGVEIKQLYNISHNSEIKHVGIVQDLVRRYNVDITTVQNVENPVATKDVAFEDMPSGKYDITKIQELYDTLYAKGVGSQQAALEVGCMVEVVDVTDLDEYISQAQEAGADDVVAAFEKLRDGSYNHYWAFDKGLKNIGISAGCGVLGSDYKKDYPQNEKGHGNGN